MRREALQDGHSSRMESGEITGVVGGAWQWRGPSVLEGVEEVNRFGEGTGGKDSVYGSEPADDGDGEEDGDGGEDGE